MMSLHTRFVQAQCELEENALQRCREANPHAIEDCQDRCTLRMRTCLAPVGSAFRSLQRRVRSGTIGPNATERRQAALDDRVNSCEEGRDSCSSQCENGEGGRCSSLQATRDQCRDRVETERRAANEAEARRLVAERELMLQRRQAELVAAVDAVRVDTPVGDILNTFQRVDASSIGNESLRAELRERLLALIISANLSDSRRRRENGDLEGSARALDMASTHLARLPAASLRRPPAVDELAREQAGLLMARERAQQLETQRQLGEARAAEGRREWREARSRYVALSSDNGIGTHAREGIARIDEHRRSPIVASVLSMAIPGAGQVYVGRPGRGIGFLLGTAAAFAGGTLLYLEADQRHSQYSAARDAATATNRYDETRQLWLGSLIAFGVGGALWLWNVLDARSGAATWNSERIGGND
jgi:hypothetical protein